MRRDRIADPSSDVGMKNLSFQAIISEEQTHGSEPVPHPFGEAIEFDPAGRILPARPVRSTGAGEVAAGEEMMFMANLSRAGKDRPARTLSKPRQTTPFRPLSPSEAIRRPAPGFQPGASFKLPKAAAPATESL
jgi:hypothetical protein